MTKPVTINGPGARCFTCNAKYAGEPIWYHRYHNVRAKNRQTNPQFCSENCLDTWTRLANRVATEQNPAIWILRPTKRQKKGNGTSDA